MTVEVIKNIMRDVDSEVSEEELDRRAIKVAKDSQTIDDIEKALENAKLSSIQMRSGTFKKMFCLHFTYVNTLKKRDRLLSVMDGFKDRVTLVKQTKTTITYGLL